MKDWSMHALLTIGLLAVVYLCFENGVHNEFTFDDHLAIEGNFDTDPSQRYGDIWLHDIWGKDLVEVDSHKSYRPLLMTVFRLISIATWNLSATEKAFYFRIVSISAHFVASCWVYALGRVVFEGEHDGGRWLAVGATLIFATHSIHVESVTAVVNLAEPMYTSLLIVCYLLFRRALVPCFLSAGDSSATKTGNVHMRTHHWSVSILLVTVWMVLVLGSSLIKETAIISCVMVWSLLGVLLVQRFWNNSPLKFAKVSVGRVIFECVLWTTAAGALVVAYFAVRRLLCSPDRDLLMSDWRQALLFLSQPRTDNYLNASQLLRRAENAFAFLHGQSRVLSMLVNFCDYYYKCMLCVYDLFFLQQFSTFTLAILHCSWFQLNNHQNMHLIVSLPFIHCRMTETYHLSHLLLSY
jgi:hypothetical protein